MNEITTVGVDLAKEHIVACAADAAGRIVCFRHFSFAGFGEWIANLPPCLIGMEACSSAHHWARTLAARGHTPRLIAAELVEPFRLSRGAKNDRADAQAVLCAVRQPAMRFVSIKSLDQQAILAWHRVRSGYQDDRRALVNRLRGLLAEFGVWVRRSAPALLRELAPLAEDERLPVRVRPLLLQSLGHLRQIDALITECDERIEAHAREHDDAQRIQALLGIGRLTASAVVASISDARDFRNGRQLAAWAGLVPRQHSTGGKTRLGPITKRGDTYLRSLLTQGARSALQVALKRDPLRRSRLEQWIVNLHGRAGYHKTLVAIANKHLRIIWAILAHGEAYDPQAWRRHPHQARAI